MNGCKIKREVTPDSGDCGIKFLIAEMEREFIIAKHAYSCRNKEIFENFAKCLKEQLSTNWKKVLADKYPDPHVLTKK